MIFINKFLPEDGRDFSRRSTTAFNPIIRRSVQVIDRPNFVRSVADRLGNTVRTAIRSWNIYTALWRPTRSKASDNRKGRARLQRIIFRKQNAWL